MAREHQVLVIAKNTAGIGARILALFNRRGFNQVLPIEKIDIIITDDAVSEVDKLALQKTRVKLITV